MTAPKTAAQWTREASTFVIELYEREPCLYEVSSRDYKNRNRRQCALEKIAKDVSVIRPNTTANHVKVKLNGLRTQYLEALNKVNASKNKSGSGTDSLYEPTLWCFEQPHFLEQHTVHFKRISFISTPTVSHDQVTSDAEENRFDSIFEEEVTRATSSSSCGSQASGTPVPKPRSKKRKADDSLDEEFNDSAKAVLASIQARRSTPKGDNLDLFGQYVVSELRSIRDPIILRNLKRKIQADISDAQDADEDIQNYL